MWRMEVGGRNKRAEGNLGFVVCFGFSFYFSFIRSIDKRLKGCLEVTSVLFTGAGECRLEAESCF